MHKKLHKVFVVVSIVSLGCRAAIFAASAITLIVNETSESHSAGTVLDLQYPRVTCATCTQPLICRVRVTYSRRA